jgi:translation elongation factor EF-Tu-like GTPase
MFRKLLDEGEAGENVGLLLAAPSARTSSAAWS